MYKMAGNVAEEMVLAFICFFKSNALEFNFHKFADSDKILAESRDWGSAKNAILENCYK